MGPVVTLRNEVPGREQPDPRTDHGAFEVVFMPEVYANTLASAALWQAGENVLRIAAAFSSREWLAVIVLHELEHVFRTKRGLEQPRPMNSDNWIRDELPAYHTECELIGVWRPKEFGELVLHTSPMLGNQIVSANDMKNAFPDLGRLTGREQSLVAGALTICSAFHWLSGDEAKIRAYRRITVTD